MLHPRRPSSFSELFTKYIMDSSDPGEFSEAWVGWWQMRWVITVTAHYRKTEFKECFIEGSFGLWQIMSHIPD